MSHNQSSILDKASHLLGYFDLQVLASYQNEPDKYRVETDYFVGHVTTTSEYYDELDRENRSHETIDVLFGFRTRSNGNLAVVAWMPDLVEKSEGHVKRWSGFHLEDPEWLDAPDERFSMWVQRYLEGSWNVQSGPLSQLARLVKKINGLTSEIFGTSLFKNEIPKSVGYPNAQNSHRYQDAHRVLYGYIIDGLDKRAIEQIAAYNAVHVNASSKRTLHALKKALPDLDNDCLFWQATARISEHRRHGAHGARLPVERMPAFERFTEDLTLTVQGLKEIMSELEHLTNTDATSAEKRTSAKERLPHIIGASNTPAFLINEASKMVGKTIERVEFGLREQKDHLHQSEALLIYFTDGSILGIDTGSNVNNMQAGGGEFKPSEFHVDFMLSWVPPLEKKKREES